MASLVRTDKRGIEVAMTFTAESKHYDAGKQRQHHRRNHQMIGEILHISGSRPSTWSVPVNPRAASSTTRNNAVVAKLMTMAVKTRLAAADW